MAKASATAKPGKVRAPSKSEVLNNIATTTGLSRKEVSAVLEAESLRQRSLCVRQRRIHRAVEHHRAHARWIVVRVERTEVGAVREAEIGDTLVAESGAYRVHVADRVQCGDVPEQAATAACATGRERLRLVDVLLYFRGVVR